MTRFIGDNTGPRTVEVLDATAQLRGSHHNLGAHLVDVSTVSSLVALPGDAESVLEAHARLREIGLLTADSKIGVVAKSSKHIDMMKFFAALLTKAGMEAKAFSTYVEAAVWLGSDAASLSVGDGGDQRAARSA